MIKKLIAAGILLTIALAAVLIHRLDKNADESVISVSGNVEVTEINVAFKIPGRVLSLFTDEGRPVAKGDKLAILDSAEYESQVAQNRANVMNAEAQLEKARKDRDRSELLYTKEAIPAQQLDDARTAYDIAVAHAALAKASLRTSEVKLKDTVIYAPTLGIVLMKNIEAGETVSAGVPIFTIGDMENFWIKVYVKENKLGLVKLGQTAQIVTDSYPDKVYEGSVSYISSEAEFTPKNVQTQEERVKLVFGIKISVKNVNDELKPGMPADVIILLK